MKSLLIIASLGLGTMACGDLHNSSDSTMEEGQPIRPNQLAPSDIAEAPVENSDAAVEISAMSFEATASFRLSGTMQNVYGTVVLRDQNGNSIDVTENGEFSFEQDLNDGENYDVVVESFNSAITCNVSNGSGTIASANVDNIEVYCQSAEMF